MNATVETLFWPADRLGEAFEALARESGLSARATTSRAAPAGAPRDDDALDHWLTDAATALGVEVEAGNVQHGKVDQTLLDGRPALVRLGGSDDPRFLALLGRRGRTLRAVAPDFSVRRIPANEVRAALCAPLEAPHAGDLDRLLADAGVPARRLERARTALLGRRLRWESAGRVWHLRMPAGASFYRQMKHAGVPRRLVGLLVAHTAQYLLWIFSWWMIGRGALGGRIDPGWLIAWGLVLLTLVPFRLYVTWTQGMLAIRGGGLLRRRLLAGALRLRTEDVRHQGVGQLLGRVIESEAVESLALGGGFLGLVAVIELLASTVVLALGAGGAIHALLLLTWVGLTLALGRRYFSLRRSWTDHRLDLTHDLVETMVGHRTRLAQQPRESWHRGEDEAVERFVDRSRGMDRAATWLVAGIPRGWLIAGLLGLAPAFIAGGASAASLAVGLGGTLLAFRALEKLAGSVWQLSGAAIAWQSARPLFRAAAEPGDEPTTVAAPSRDDDPAAAGAPLLDAHNLIFRYRQRGEPVLRNCGLRIKRGDRLLLEGPSGGGKSTLVSLLAGLRQPESGLMLLGGLDRGTIGARGWLRRVATAPQYHENHVLAETFAFNLLMGRRWPPTQEDFQEAETICRELGLGELLERMPAGLLQRVGETGWQLSHGERSRLYIARALLQRADLIVLDESFAALDPENLRRCLRCVLDRAPTLLVVAHP